MASRHTPTQIQTMMISDTLLTKKYKILNRLGQGCFGAVYKVINIEKNVERALKIEVLKKGKNNNRPTLHNQFLVLAHFKNSVPGVSKVYCYGQWKYGFFLQIDLYQQDIFNVVHFKNKIRGNQLNQLTLSLLKTLRDVHRHGIIHQDLKPQNIMRVKVKPGIQSQNNELKESNSHSKQNQTYEIEYANQPKEKYQYFLIDFGISYQINPINQQKDSGFKIVRGFIGTPRYASIAAHKNQAQSKKDDLEALFYVLAFSYYKQLPWFKLNLQQKQKLTAIMKKKINCSYQLFKSMGNQYLRAYQYIKNLKRQSQPNYQYLMSLFKRTQSVIITREIPDRINNAQKRLTLPADKTNLLMIPTLNTIQDDSSKITKSGSNKSLMNLSAYSQKVQSQLVNKIFSQNQIKEMKQFKVIQHFEENILEDQSEEPAIGNISKYSNVLHLNEKNPFIQFNNNFNKKDINNNNNNNNNNKITNKSKFSQNKFTIYVRRQSQEVYKKV